MNLIFDLRFSIFNKFKFKFLNFAVIARTPTPMEIAKHPEMSS